MAVTQERREAGGPAVRTTSVEENTFKPVKVLAAVGVLALVVEAWVIGRWVTGPNFKQTPIGPSAVPTYMKVGLTGLTAIGLVAWFVCMWYFLVKPWRYHTRQTKDTRTNGSIHRAKQGTEQHSGEQRCRRAARQHGVAGAIKRVCDRQPVK